MVVTEISEVSGSSVIQSCSEIWMKALKKSFAKI